MSDNKLEFTSVPGKRNGTTILKISGPITLNTIFGFQNELRAMTPPVLIVDLSDSPFMDSAGLGLLMNQYVSAEAGQRKFLLAAVNPRIEALLEMTKVTAILKSYPTVEAAEESLG